MSEQADALIAQARRLAGGDPDKIIRLLAEALAWQSNRVSFGYARAAWPLRAKAGCAQTDNEPL